MSQKQLRLKMIVLKKIEFLRPFLVHAAIFMRSSKESKQQQLSVSAQKAVWATSIMKTISRASLPISLRDPTLCDVILNLSDPSKKFIFDKAEKDEVMKLFTEGTTLASPFKLSGSWIKFFPNRTVTTQMFKELMKPFYNPSQNLLLVGCSGISKTVSIILFIHLSYHQTRFVFEASKDEKKKEEYVKLAKLGLVPDQVVKYWFWQVRKDSDDQMKKQIQAQAVELEPAIRAELLKQPQLMKFLKKLKSHYNIPNLLQRPIVDQLTTITVQMEEQDQNRQRYYKSPKFQLYQSFKTFLKLGTNYTLISKQPINRKMLKKASNDTLNLDLVGSQRGLKTVNISYEKTMLTKEGQFDFWQIFWFKIESYSRQSSAQLKAAKQTFYKSIQSRKQLSNNMQPQKPSTLSIYSRIDFISSFLLYAVNRQEPQITTHTKLMKSIKSKNYQEIQNIISIFHPFILTEFQQEMTNFLQQQFRDDREQSCIQNGEQKYYILLKLYLKACKLKEKEQYRFSSFILTAQQLNQILWEDIPSYDHSDEDYAKQEIQILQEFQTEQAVKFKHTLEEFTVLAKAMLFRSQPRNIDFLQSKNRYLGLVPGNYLINCLVEQGTLSFNATQKPSNIQAAKHFKIFRGVPFDQLGTIRQAKQGESVFEQHFRSAIQMAIKSPGKDILALPYFMADGKRVRYASQNPAMDFAILKYNKLLNIFQIESFDVTVSRNLTQNILQARKLFTKLFEGVSSIKGIPFSLTHTYLCPKNATYKQQDISNALSLTIPLTIMYANILDLTVTTKKFCNLSLLQYVLKLITPEKDKAQYGALLRKHDR